MGVCASCGISEQEKAQQEPQAAAEQRRLVIEASEPVRLLSASPEFELAVHEANTVLEVLQIRAVQNLQMGLPKAAAASLKLEFSGAIISRDKTLGEAGLCDQAKISVQGENEAKATTEQADKVNIHNGNAAYEGKADEVRLMLDFYPDHVDATGRVRQSLARLSLLLIVRWWVDRMGHGETPLHWAAMNNHCQVAEILITAGADIKVLG